MFRRHTPDRLIHWSNKLHYFRYVRTPQEADSIKAKWLYQNVEEIMTFSEQTGFEIEVFENKPELPKMGVTYTSDYTFTSVIPDTKWWKQPNRVTIGGESVSIWCSNGSVRMSIFHGKGEVFEEQFESALRLEKILLPLNLNFEVPPVGHKYCFCKENYPEYFSSGP